MVVLVLRFCVCFVLIWIVELNETILESACQMYPLLLKEIVDTLDYAGYFTIFSTALTNASSYSLYSNTLSANKWSLVDGLIIPCWAWNLSDWPSNLSSLWGGGSTIYWIIDLDIDYLLEIWVSLRLGLDEFGILRYSNLSILSWCYLLDGLDLINAPMI